MRMSAHVPSATSQSPWFLFASVPLCFWRLEFFSQTNARAGYLRFGQRAIWPILGSMFMFRLILYFYELRHDKTPASVTQTLSYFSCCRMSVSRFSR